MPSPSTATLDPVTTPRRGHGLPRSTERLAVDDMVQGFATAERITLNPTSVSLDSGARVLVDGASDDGSLLVEAHPACGPVRDIDLALAVQDVFKLALLRAERPTARAVLLVRDDLVRDTVIAHTARTPAAGLVEIRVHP